MDDIIKAPFTKEQVKKLNEYQMSGCFHPFTCCGHDGCVRDEDNNYGLLIATEDGWVCPCGKWKQDWAHKFMSKGPPKEFIDFKSGILPTLEHLQKLEGLKKLENLKNPKKRK